MQRRRWLKWVALLPSVTWPVSFAFASEQKKNIKEVSSKFSEIWPSLEGVIIFTKAKPGRWIDKVGSHVPSMTLLRKDEKLMITVTTMHEMQPEHFIVKHLLLDQHCSLIGEKVFSPQSHQVAQSIHFIESNYQGPLFAVSVCNKHDVWLESLVV
jgi:superoxide reductase